MSFFEEITKDYGMIVENPSKIYAIKVFKEYKSKDPINIFHCLLQKKIQCKECENIVVSFEKTLGIIGVEK